MKAARVRNACLITCTDAPSHSAAAPRGSTGGAALAHKAPREGRLLCCLPAAAVFDMLAHQMTQHRLLLLVEMSKQPGIGSNGLAVLARRPSLGTMLGYPSGDGLPRLAARSMFAPGGYLVRARSIYVLGMGSAQPDGASAGV